MNEEKAEAPRPDGPRPRLLAPLLAAGMIALSLARLEVLPWAVAATLFGGLAVFVAATELRKRNRDGRAAEDGGAEEVGEVDGED